MCKNRPMKKDMDLILQAIPYDFSICERPYEEIAKEAGISEDGLINVLKDLKVMGVIAERLVN